MECAPTTAPKIGSSLSDPIKMYLGDIYTISVNLAGLPGISVIGLSAECGGTAAEYFCFRGKLHMDFQTDEELHQMYKRSRSQGFGPEVKRRIMLGSFVLSSGYYDAYYLKALRVKALIKKAFDEAFAKYDMILGPNAFPKIVSWNPDFHAPYIIHKGGGKISILSFHAGGILFIMRCDNI